MEDNKPLMPMATAVWLIDQTGITFRQIAEFVGVHELEIQAIADGRSQNNVLGISPIDNGQLSAAEIDKCQKDPKHRLSLNKNIGAMREKYGNRTAYVPLIKRQQRVEVIAWVLRHHPGLADADVAKLLGSTLNSVTNVRKGTHPTGEALTLRHPVESGFCTRAELDALVAAARLEKQAAEESEKEDKKRLK